MIKRRIEGKGRGVIGGMLVLDGCVEKRVGDLKRRASRKREDMGLKRKAMGVTRRW